MKRKQFKKGKQEFQSVGITEQKKSKKPREKNKNQKRFWLEEAFEGTHVEFQDQAE